MITWRLPSAKSEAALRLAREVVFPNRDMFSVPKFNVVRASPGLPTAWFICPDNDHPSGGVRKLYRSVDILNDAGFHAAIVHERSGFHCTWFNHRTRVISSSQAIVKQSDVIVVPEIYGASISNLPAGIRQIIFNQNVYNTIGSLADGGFATAAYINNPDLAGVVVVSQDNATVFKYVFPDLRLQCVRNGIDPSLYHPPKNRKHRRIAYMPRRRGQEAAQVMELLKLRGVIGGWEIVAIDGRSEAVAAELLQTSQIFLSFSRLEGFRTSPARGSGVRMPCDWIPWLRWA